MALVESRGNNYVWVTHSWNPMGGRCSYGCSYCYVSHSEQFGNLPKYQGEYRLIEKELKIPFGSEKNIFVCNMTDLFAETVPLEIIGAILKKCRENPENEYTFQTKNPLKMIAFALDFPEKSYLGTTIETDAYPDPKISNAPTIARRVSHFMNLQDLFEPRMIGANGCWPKFFVTIEPIIMFNLGSLAGILYSISPDFVNIGADSKGTSLPEPSAETLKSLVARLKEWKIEVRLKANLGRILKSDLGGF